MIEIVRLPKVGENIGVSNPPGRWHVLGALGSEGFFMQAIANNDGSVLVAPERLISGTRGDFRSAALQHIDELGDAASAIVIDLTQTIEMDTSGLGMLVFIQKRAKERGYSTILRRAPERVRNLLKLTLLEFLFEFRD